MRVVRDRLIARRQADDRPVEVQECVLRDRRGDRRAEVCFVKQLLSAVDPVSTITEIDRFTRLPRLAPLRQVLPYPLDKIPSRNSHSNELLRTILTISYIMSTELRARIRLCSAR